MNTNQYQAPPAMPMERQSINTTPPEDFNTEAMQGSFQQIISENIGLYVHIDFLIGTTKMIRKSGYLFSVGRSIVTIYDDINNVYVTCDVFSIKFVTFLLPGQHTPGVPSQTPVTPIPHTTPTDSTPPVPTMQTSRQRRMV